MDSQNYLKQCRVCKKHKDEQTEFSFSKHVPTKRNKTCHECAEASLLRTRKWREKNPNYQKNKRDENREEHRRKAREYRKNNKEIIAAQQRRWRLKDKDRTKNKSLKWDFGITVDIFNKKMEEQGGKCAICGKNSDTEGTNLHIDHNHTTNTLRGLLCGNCNRGIGSFMEDVNVIQSSIEYLQKANTEVVDQLGRTKESYFDNRFYSTSIGLRKKDVRKALLEKLGDKCKICGKTMVFGASYKDRPNIDHNHTTGMFRGFLCSFCNAGIGLFQEDIKILNSAIRYIKEWENRNTIQPCSPRR